MTGAIMPEDPKAYPNLVAELNQKAYKGQVKELYGSLRSSYSKLPTARPDFRLEQREWTYLEKYIQECHKHGLIFNYTMNASFIGSLSEISSNYDDLVESLHKLEEIGVDRVTCSHPLLMEIVCKHTNLPIEVSTIMNISSLQAPAGLKEKYPNINKICMGIDKVRNIDFVKQLNSVCQALDIELEVMVSEFCMSNQNMSCNNSLRSSCYQMHAMNMSQNEAQNGVNDDNSVQPKEIKGFPWVGKNGCVFSKSIDNTTWLSSRTIWPNDIQAYLLSTNVKNIKVTTRTAPPQFGIQLTEYYAKGEYNGLLAGLWLQLQVSTNDKRHENFDKAQEKFSKITPFTCKMLSDKHHLEGIHIPFIDKIESFTGSFMSLFFAFTSIDWNDVVWVDKPAEECLPWESNWVHLWKKLLAKQQEEV